MPLTNPLAKRGPAEKSTEKSTETKASAPRRSLGDLAKMDIGDLRSLARLPRRSGSHGRAKRAASRQVVGLDIEPGFVTAAQVSVNGKLVVERAAGVELAPEVVRDGEVVDVVALSEALKTLFAEHKLDPRVRLGIANQRIVVRTLELPPIEDLGELETAVRFQAQNELPMSLDSAVIDYHALGITETAAGPRQRVVLVAARREMIERLMTAAREAGLRPEGIDLSAFALIRSLHVPGSASDERVVYLSLGGVGNLAVAEGGVCQFTRVLSIGLESIAGEVAERLGVSVTDARAMLLTQAGLEEESRQPERPGLYAGPVSPLETGAIEPADADASLSSVNAHEPDPYAAPQESYAAPQDNYAAPQDNYAAPQDNYAAPQDRFEAPQDRYEAPQDSYESPQDGPSDVEAAVRALLAESVRRIGVEIRNSLHYHAIHGGEQAATRVRVSGAMAKIPGFIAALGNELELDVELAVVEAARPGVFDDVPAERLAVATGLAVTEMPA